jgi:hypothetical protein
MRVAEQLVSYFFYALIIAVIVTNGQNTSSIITSVGTAANSVSAGILGARR